MASDIPQRRLIQAAPTPMAQVAQLTGPAAMPFPRVPYFSGLEDSIENFLQEYEELADSHGLTDRQKVETVIRYVAPSQRDLWKLLDGYIAHDWDDLCLALKDIYVDTTTQGRSSRQKLYEFTIQSAQSRMNEQGDILQYYRRFLLLSKPLLDSHVITTKERDGMFWCGFHPEDRPFMSSRLIAMRPEQPVHQPFDYQDVLRIARAVFRGNNVPPFDQLDLWDHSPAGGYGMMHTSRPWFGQDERDPRESDRDWRARERKLPSSEHSRTVESFGRWGPEEHPEYRTRENLGRRGGEEPFFPEYRTREEECREIDDLVNQLRGMSARDRSYATLYARCARRFPNIARDLPKPEFM